MKVYEESCRNLAFAALVSWDKENIEPQSGNKREVEDRAVRAYEYRLKKLLRY